MPLTAKVAASSSSGEDEIHIFRFNLSTLSKLQQFLVLGSGVFFFFLIHGLLQEDIFKMRDFASHVWFANLVQFVVCALCGLFEMSLKQELRIRRASMPAYTMAGLLTVLTVALGNEACCYLNYPTLIVFKCCKLVPLLIGGIIIQRKWYTMWQFLGCTLMTLGLSLFVLADSSVVPLAVAPAPASADAHVHIGNEKSVLPSMGSEAGQISAQATATASLSYPNAKGVVLISIAVLSDAALTNVQEHLMATLRVSCIELITYTYGMGAALIGLRCVLELGVSGFTASSAFFFVEPWRFVKLVSFGMATYLGVMCFALLIRSSGSLIAVMVNTCRRAVTIVLSFVLYAKPFTPVYLLAGVVVLLGIVLNVREEERLKTGEVVETKEKERDKLADTRPVQPPIETVV